MKASKAYRLSRCARECQVWITQAHNKRARARTPQTASECSPHICIMDTYHGCVLEVISKCSRNALGMVLQCVRYGIEMFSKCSRTVFGMFSKCSRNVLEMFSNCFRNVLEMFSICFRNVFELFSNCFRRFSNCCRTTIELRACAIDM